MVIPARYAATRLPGKPLRDLNGKPLVQHVWQRACASAAGRVVIATDDERVFKAAQGFGAEVCMTRADHPSGTDRLAEVIEILGLPDDLCVVNVQGDEPLLAPENIDQVAANLLAHPDVAAATLCEPLLSGPQLKDPNLVKVVTDHQGLALYFSRAPIPWPRQGIEKAVTGLEEDSPWQRHIGIYAYRAAFVRRFVGLRQSPLELLESLEQLRMLWHGHAIHVAQAVADSGIGVDTEQDLARAAAVLAGR